MEQQSNPEPAVEPTNEPKPGLMEYLINFIPWAVIGILIGILGRLAYIKDFSNGFSTYIRAISISWQILSVAIFLVVIFRWKVIKLVFSKPQYGSLLSPKNLFIGIPIGIGVGIVISIIQQKYLPQITEILYWATLVSFGVMMLSFILFYGLKKPITSLIFGEKVANAREITEEAQKVSDELFDHYANKILKDVPLDVREKVRDVLPRLTNWFVWRHFRNWWWQWVLGIFVALGGLTGTLLLMNQNELLEAQNVKIDSQTTLMQKQTELAQQQMSLSEASRRSALVVLMSNIMDKVDREIESQQKGLSFKQKEKMKYKLSQSLIGQIAALSLSFKPYLYLEGDTLIEKPLSPERGQLLITLTQLPLDRATFVKIYSSSTFAKADLRDAKLVDAYLEGANLREADLRVALLNNATLRAANLDEADLRGAVLNDADLSVASLFNANLVGASFSESNLRGALLSTATLYFVTFAGADLSGADLQGANGGGYFYKANLTGANLTRMKMNSGTVFVEANLNGAILNGVDLSNVYLDKADLSRADLEGANLTIKQASSVRTFFNCQGINDSVKIALMKTHPQLFEELKEEQ